MEPRALGRRRRRRLHGGREDRWRQDRIALRSRDDEDAAHPALRRGRRADPVRDGGVEPGDGRRHRPRRGGRKQDRPPVHRGQGGHRLLGRCGHRGTGRRTLHDGRRRRDRDDAAGLDVLHHGPGRPGSPGRLGRDHRRRAGPRHSEDPGGPRLWPVAHRLQRVASPLAGEDRRAVAARQHHAQDGRWPHVCQRHPRDGGQRVRPGPVHQRGARVLPADRRRGALPARIDSGLRECAHRGDRAGARRARDPPHPGRVHLERQGLGRGHALRRQHRGRCLGARHPRPEGRRRRLPGLAALRDPVPHAAADRRRAAAGGRPLHLGRPCGACTLPQHARLHGDRAGGRCGGGGRDRPGCQRAPGRRRQGAGKAARARHAAARRRGDRNRLTDALADSSSRSPEPIAGAGA
ncbi:putative Uncharacterized 50.6 kDa protein in the 5'region of gyrA and gyrB [Burkholderiales bacterium 8X]|nr:putative Uncharacterized 50.6 kDa protein in the 5'region of gyrA and gyrB [Burkholderiales bacterium 8X]